MKRDMDEELREMAKRPMPMHGPYPLHPDVTEEAVAAWWNSKTPKQRYYGIGYSGWSDAEIDRPASPFVGNWESLAKDVRDGFIAGIKNGAIKYP